jgi:magnesium chelatase subunit D
MGKRVDFPFTAIIGYEAAKRALLLLAIDPGLRGVLIGAGTGSAKSTLALSFAAVSGDDKPPIPVPVNITEQNLLGGLDVEQSIAAGKRVYLPGLLARADGGILFIEDVNSLDAKVASHIASALDSERVKIERDGFSAVSPTRFRLIGAYNPVDGLAGAALFDRVGMIVESTPVRSTDERADIITRSIQFNNDPQEFGHRHAITERELKAGVEQARKLLPKIEIKREQIRSLAQVALSLGVRGSRTDLFAVKAARASAASFGRDRVEEDDLIVAIQLVLMPRATTLPQFEQVAKPDDPATTEQSSEDNLDDSTESDRRGAGNVAPVEDLIIKAIDATAPELLFERMRNLHRESKTGKRGAPLHADRGRAMTGDSERRRQSTISLFATLCAAAPFQAMRRKPSRSIIVKKSDIRFKRFKSSTGILFIFAVDASGSMALNRMAQAKGALARILQQAYLHRDKVALVSFRGEKADTLLAPTRSLERAKSLIDSLPAGGGTPIAAGLVRALEMANSARLRGMSQVMVVVMTDGRANVLSRASSRVDRIDQDAINEELRQIGRIMRSGAIQSVVIDTKSRFVSSGEARNLADMLGGKYLYLPRAGAAGIHKAVELAASGMRRNSSV